MGTIRHQLKDHIAIIRFDNPPHGLFDREMTAHLEALLGALAADEEVRVVVLTGQQPDVFIRHFDLPELANMAEALAGLDPAPDPDPEATWESSPFHRITRCLETMPQPVIAAINGTCMGVGYELALGCDIRIASEGDYPIGLPELNIAMLPGGGGTARLGRLVGQAVALELICSATTVTPQQAARLGMVNRVEPEALAAALQLAQDIARLSPSGVAAAKAVIRASADLDITDALTLEQRAVNGRLGTAEVRAALRQRTERNVGILDCLDR